jgi:hypothetical protein
VNKPMGTEAVTETLPTLLSFNSTKFMKQPTHRYSR